MSDKSKNVTSAEELRSMYKEPSVVAQEKVLTELDEHCQKMISLSPFACLATTAADGSLDISPRGDPPGSIKVLNSSELLIADRYGNNRLDTLTNLTLNPEIALIFLVPGMIETLRVSGHAEIISDEERLGTCVIDGKRPTTGILVHVHRAFLQCGKALKRSALWEGAYQIERTDLASFGTILKDQTNSQLSADELDCSIHDAYRNKLY